MIRFLLTICLVLCSVTSFASDQLYRRVATWQYYYQNGCQYRRQVWTYQPYYNNTSNTYNTTVITKQDLSEDGWRGKLLDIAKQRDAWEGSMRKSSIEHGEFVDSIKVLGLQNNFRWNGYGYQFEEGNQGSYNSYGAQGYSSQVPAQQGSTIYGYRESADIYGNVDLMAAINGLLRLREQSYDNESVATSEVHSLVSDMGADAARVAEINAKAKAASEVLKAASAQERVSILKEFWEKGTLPKSQGQSQQTVSTANDLNTIISNRCLKCHNDTKKEGNFSLSGDVELDGPIRKAILERITTTDQKLHMPPGVNLPINEVGTLFQQLYK